MPQATSTVPVVQPQTPRAVLWDIADQAPEQWTALAAVAPTVTALLAEWRGCLPCATSISPFDQGDLVRPYRHLRAFYQRVPGGVIAFKGTEPYAADRVAHLNALLEYRVSYPGRGQSLFSAAEHFALVEQKIPLVVTLDEALEDAQAASRVQRAHLARFGELARIPTPLLVLAWPLATRDSCIAALQGVLSERAFKIVQTSAQGGLGAVVYFYPRVPLRVAHLPVELPRLGPGSWLERLRQLTDPPLVLARWIDLVARMLALGFLPGRTEHIGIGHCLEMQNAVIDGGFVDLGSVVAMDQVRSDRAFLEMLLAAFSDLTKTARQFATGPTTDAEAEYRNPSLAMLLASHRVLPALLDRLRQYGPLDPRLERIVHQRSPFEALVDELGVLSPASASGAEHA